MNVHYFDVEPKIKTRPLPSPRRRQPLEALTLDTVQLFSCRTLDPPVLVESGDGPWEEFRVLEHLVADPVVHLPFISYPFFMFGNTDGLK